MDNIKRLYKEVPEVVQKMLLEKYPEINFLTMYKWYKVKGDFNIIVQYHGEKGGCGTTGERWFFNNNWSLDIYPEEWIPATQSEVKDILIKEAIKRGLWGDVDLKYNARGDSGINHTTAPLYNMATDNLWGKRGLIFHHGKWGVKL